MRQIRARSVTVPAARLVRLQPAHVQFNISPAGRQRPDVALGASTPIDVQVRLGMRSRRAAIAAQVIS
jgi:hypothetical protein